MKDHVCSAHEPASIANSYLQAGLQQAGPEKPLRGRELARTPTHGDQRYISQPNRNSHLGSGRAPARNPSDGLRSADSPDRIDQPSVSSNTGILSPPTHCDEAQSALGIAQRIFELSSQHIDESTTSAIPGYRAGASTNYSVSASAAAEDYQRSPISSILGGPFPPMDLVYCLLEEYFDAIHWFSLAIYEPKFRKMLNSIADGSANPSDKPWLLLLSVMLAMATWYQSQRTGTDLADTGEEWRTLSARLLKIVESNLVEIMDRPSITAIQTCVLLGSHYVYHGRPSLSFSLLGTTIKMSQSLGFHRRSTRGTFEDIEERKRIWWTIYTWDRFASITYGRPLGISDKDCNVEMPVDTPENPLFRAAPADPESFITYSPYQRELNKLYLIASPALEIVFGSRTTGSDNLTGDAYYELAKEATQNLQRWSSQLPSHLSLNLGQDLSLDEDLEFKVHALQSLALQLTYDNVLIVLHRPLLNRQVDYLSNKTQGGSAFQGDSPIDHSSAGPAMTQSSWNFDGMNSRFQDDSSRLWMNAAVRTSRVTELPVLAQLATDSHLVAFLAINLFNAAIVLAVMALSEPLSDMAQDIKRTITRILRLQDLLGKRSALSKQSTLVLRNVVILLLHRESATIFAPISGPNRQPHALSQQDSIYHESMSVEDTLRLPLNPTLESRNQHPGDQTWLPPSRADRLNESLTSVQYVFGSNEIASNLVLGTETPVQGTFADETIQPRGNWSPSSGYDWNASGIVEDGLRQSTYDAIDGGLCWLWDTTWNGFERQ
ncbi:hypothetical protein N7509_006322 [Penicillium cosmopolitanum]|uniref:Xylanolytic transcriptional activator regulatory domain-containing protein n=1 Tax=Penicillium cosmopolitanum TaxID=1131564 RepID=A0A9X0BAZ0_9EURO|nr:uncharacterized protein N7509_006322 [Penicillium cosmopolitanum]KAJ5398209.1 hypothetical protein N7509_006322 [Penicillium cosmopolitanum]